MIVTSIVTHGWLLILFLGVLIGFLEPVNILIREGNEAAIVTIGVRSGELETDVSVTFQTVDDHQNATADGK